jgi:hypothetical protein
MMEPAKSDVHIKVSQTLACRILCPSGLPYSLNGVYAQTHIYYILI